MEAKVSIKFVKCKQVRLFVEDRVRPINHTEFEHKGILLKITGSRNTHPLKKVLFDFLNGELFIA